MVKIVWFLEWLFGEEFPGQAENCRVCHNDTIDHLPKCWIGSLINRVRSRDEEARE